MTDDAAPFYRRLACGVIIRSLQDAQSGRPCDGRCSELAHVCADDARAFLESDGCAEILDALGLDPERLPEVLASLRGGHLHRPGIRGRKTAWEHGQDEYYRRRG